jgi:hypothetical protein
VHDYLLAHPEVLPEAVERLKANEGASQVAAVGRRRSANGPAPCWATRRASACWWSSWIACGYCRASEADVARLIAANPDLKVVLRQLPILSPQSADAAKMGLAAAAQGKYAAFHHAMYAAGHLTPETIAATAAPPGWTWPPRKGGRQPAGAEGDRGQSDDGAQPGHQRHAKLDCGRQAAGRRWAMMRWRAIAPDPAQAALNRPKGFPAHPLLR